ncbi:MAG: hypothetical protein R2856_30765 [Caldilineaceae bacterium]
MGDVLVLWRNLRRRAGTLQNDLTFAIRRAGTWSEPLRLSEDVTDERAPFVPLARRLTASPPSTSACPTARPRRSNTWRRRSPRQPMPHQPRRHRA